MAGLSFSLPFAGGGGIGTCRRAAGENAHAGAGIDAEDAAIHRKVERFAPAFAHLHGAGPQARHQRDVAGQHAEFAGLTRRGHRDGRAGVVFAVGRQDDEAKFGHGRSLSVLAFASTSSMEPTM